MRTNAWIWNSHTVDSQAVAPVPAKAAGGLPHGRKAVVIIVLLVLLLALPAICLFFTPYSAAMGATVAGMLPALLGVVVGGVRRGITITLVAIVAVGIAPVGLLYPALGVVLIGAMGVFTGFAAYHGLDKPAFTVAWLVAMTMLAPPALTNGQLQNGVVITPGYILALLAATALGGLWALLVMVGVDRKLPPRPLVPLPLEAALVYGGTMAALTSLAGAVALTWFPYSLAGWVILTIYIVGRPTFKDDTVSHGILRKSLDRGFGTAVGVIIASLIAAVVHSPNTLLLIGVLLMAPAMVALLSGRPYWQYVIIFTTAMVFLDSNGIHTESVAAARIICTFIGIAMALLALLFNRRYTFPWIGDAMAKRAAAQQQVAN